MDKVSDMPLIYHQLPSTNAQTFQSITLSPVFLPISRTDVRQMDDPTFLDACANCYPSNKSIPLHNLNDLDKYIEGVGFFLDKNFTKKKVK